MESSKTKHKGLFTEAWAAQEMSKAARSPQQVAPVNAPKGVCKDTLAREWREQNASIGDGKNDFSDWVRMVTSFSSMHGFVWYTRVESFYLRIILIVLMVVVCIFTPTFMILQTVDFYKEVKLVDAIDWRRATAIVYPNITVCDSRFFDSEKMAALNISDLMANYMAMGLHPNSGAIVRYNTETSGQNFTLIMDGLKQELDALLVKHNVDMSGLLKMIAVDCDDVIAFCDIHSQFLFSKSVIPTTTDDVACCKVYFDDEPMFTPQGTCFTTKRNPVERQSYVYSSIGIWTYVDTTKRPEFMMMFGVDAVERNGIFFTLTNSGEHPFVGMSRKPFGVSRGQATSVALSIKEIDRTEVNEEFCARSEAEQFELNYATPYTKSNCEMFQGAGQFLSSCSVLALFGMEPDKSKPPCKPYEVFDGAFALPWNDSLPHGTLMIDSEDNSETDNEFLAKKREIGDYCKYECNVVEYIVKTNSRKMNGEPVKTYVPHLTPDHFTYMQFYFDTFGYEKHVMQQETFSDFISKIGGWFGLALGASLVSFLELMYFVCSFCLVHGKRYCSNSNMKKI